MNWNNGNNAGEYGNVLPRSFIDQRMKEIRETGRQIRDLETYSPPPHGPGEQSYVTVREAIGTLGLMANHRKIAIGLLESLVSGRSMIEVAKEAQGAGIPSAAVTEMLRRGSRLIEEARAMQRPVLGPRGDARDPREATKSIVAYDTLMKANKRQRKKAAKKEALGGGTGGGDKRPKQFTQSVGHKGGFRKPGTTEYWYPGMGVTNGPHPDDHADVHAAHAQHLQGELDKAKEKVKPDADVHAEFKRIDDKAREAGIRLDGAAAGHHTIEDMEKLDASMDRLIAAKNQKEGQELSSPQGGEESKGGDESTPQGDNDEFADLSPRDQADAIETQVNEMENMVADAEEAGGDPEAIAAAKKRVKAVKAELKAIKTKGAPKAVDDLERLKLSFKALRYIVMGMLMGMMAGGGPGGMAGIAGGSAAALGAQKRAKALNDEYHKHREQKEKLTALHKQLTAPLGAEAKTDEAEAKTDEAEAKTDEAEAKTDEAEAKTDEAEAKPNRAERRKAAAQSRAGEASGPRKAKPEGSREQRKTARKQQRSSRRGNRAQKGIYLDLENDRLVFAKAFTVEDVHEAADDAGVDWDDNRAFMDKCEKLTGKRHLDDMSERELRIVASNLEKADTESAAVSAKIKLLMDEGYPQKQAVAIALDMQRRGKLSKAGPFIGPRGGKWADAKHTIPWEAEKPKRRAAPPKPTRKSPGSQLDPAVREKLKSLGVTKLPEAAIPTSVIQVNFDNPDTTAVIKWKDTKGRTQSGYTPAFHKTNAKKKWDRVMALRPQMAEIDRKLQRDLKAAPAGSTKQQGLLIANIISMTGLRPGSTNMLEGRFGTSTLHPSHVKITGNRIDFEFVGKQGKVNTATIKNKAVADALRPYVKGGNKKNKPMFARAALASSRKELPKGMYLKDLRTIKATNTAIAVLSTVIKPPPLTGERMKDKKLLARAILQASKEVAKVINNTPAVARSTYVHPEVFRLWAIEKAGADPSLFDEASTAPDLEGLE